MALSMLMPFMFVGIIAVILFIVFAARKNSEMSEEDMIKNVYIYLVLFVTLMMIIGGSVGVFMAIADMVAPTPYYMSYHDYTMRYQEKPSESAGIYEYSLTEEEMRIRYESMVIAETERQLNRAQNNLIKSAGWVVVPLPVFMFFQRKLNKVTPSKKEEAY